MFALVLVAAIVTQDATPLRAAAKETAARQTLLYAGDWLELRGERQGWLQVYDHRHERPGYVRPSQVRAFPVEEKSAGELAAVIDFVRDQPGAESLGIGLAALFLRAAPANAVGAEVFDALGGMAERLGRRASSKWARPNDATLAGQIEVAESYGIKFSFVREREGRTRALLRRRGLSARAGAAGVGDGEGARGARADRSGVRRSGDRRVRARDAGGVAGGGARRSSTRRRCATLPAWLANRVRVRAAAVRAEVTYAKARKGDLAAARAAEAEAERALAAVDKPELADDDALGLRRSGAARGARCAGPPSRRRRRRDGDRPGKSVEIAAGKPGETCVRFAKRRALHLRRGVAVVGARVAARRRRRASRSRRCRRGRSWCCCGAGTSRRRWRRRRSIPTSATSSSPAGRPTGRGCAWRKRRA